MLTAPRAFRSPATHFARDFCSAPRVCKAVQTRKGTRNIATSTANTLDPIIHGYATELQQKQPCFSMPAKNVRILSEPQTFYQTLLEKIRHAKSRIFISSLYIGEEEHELVDTLHASLASNESLTLDVHLDLNRTTRPGPNSPVNLLLPLLKQHPERVKVHLFRSPALRGLMAKVVPPRFNEGWGTWHVKIYGVDNDVLISGANLSKSYFTNRRDRYFHFTRQQNISQYCFDYLRAASTFSYRLSSPSTSGTYDLHWSNSQHPHRFHKSAQEALTALQSMYHSRMKINEEDDVLVYPVIQAGQFELREEVETVTTLFQHLSVSTWASWMYNTPGPVVDLTSGYFGLSDTYRRLVIESDVDCRIIAASPQANGFYGSRGLSGRIPDGYTLLEQSFMRSVTKAKRSWNPLTQKGIELREWARDGWTYHSKGIWLSPTPSEDPFFTLIGSTNLAARSEELDVELSFALLTQSTDLRAELGKEVQGLREHAVPWQGADRKVSLGTKVLVGMVGGML